MSGCVDEVELIGLTILGRVHKADRLRLDRDPALALNLHSKSDLRFHFPLGQTTTILNKAIRKGRFTMVNMCDNRKISDVTKVCHIPNKIS